VAETMYVLIGTLIVVGFAVAGAIINDRVASLPLAVFLQIVLLAAAVAIFIWFR
jgi:hypothetical protein